LEHINKKIEKANNENLWKSSYVDGPDGSEDTKERTSKFISIEKGIPVSNAIMEKAKEVFKVHTPGHANFDNLQIIKYTPGQKFTMHHDAGTLLGYEKGWEECVVDLTSKRRFTMFVYLNTLEEGHGGRTQFPLLGKSSRPIKDVSIAWTNVKPDGSAEERTIHCGEEVKGGVKYGMNIWYSL
jgi:prolyl 4-hydroxylase